MNTSKFASVVLLYFLFSLKTLAFDELGTLTIDAFPDHIKRQQVEERLAPHSDSLLGDLVDINTGTVKFVHTDVAIPGNSSLEVALRRTRTGGFKFPHKDAASRKAFSVSSIPLKNTSQAFGDWELDVPNVSQLVPFGYDVELNLLGIDTSSIDFCSVEYFTRAIHVVYGAPEFRGFIEHEDLSNGVMLTTQRGHEARLLDFPKGLDWPSGTVKVTTDHWYARCISNPAGVNGLEVFSPTGDRYIFDQVQFRNASAVPTIALDSVTNTRIYTSIPRIEVRLQASEVRDKHGNWVRYSYNSAGWVTRIFSNDGREIKVNYDGGLVRSVEANDRTWHYRYGITQNNDSYLTSVELPDSSKWQFDLAEAQKLEAFPEQDCEARDQQWQLVHPDGVAGTFLFSETRHAIGSVRDFKSPFCDGRNPVYVGFYDVMSIKRKTLAGPNYPSRTWKFNYSGFPAGASGATKWGEVVNPTGEKIRTTFHNLDDYNLEGLTKRVETFSSTGVLEERVDFEYVVEGEVGDSLMDDSNQAKLHRPRHQSRVVVRRGADTYNTGMIYNTTQTSSKYSYGRPTQIDRTSNVNSDMRRTNFTYQNMMGLWLLGLPLTENLNGELQNSYVYDSKGRMTSNARYGSVVT